MIYVMKLKQELKRNSPGDGIGRHTGLYLGCEDDPI